MNHVNNEVEIRPRVKMKEGTEEEDIVLKEEHILSVLTPDTKLANEWNRVYGSGLVLPQEDLIH